MHVSGFTSTCKNKKKEKNKSHDSHKVYLNAYLNLGEREKWVKGYLSENYAPWKYIKTKRITFKRQHAS